LSKAWKVRFSGRGGQGIITSGIILADAVVREGGNAVQYQSYGAEARGGASKSDVIVSDGKILYPNFENPNLLLCMSKEGLDRHLPLLSEDGILILDDTMIPDADIEKFTPYRIPITGIAISETGAEITANIVALGAMIGITKMASEAFVIEALENRMSEKLFERNLRALKAGIRTAKELSGENGKDRTSTN
jgi:2-oxoglutarate ferredoxin oxidoreductase subunit gamma